MAKVFTEKQREPGLSYAAHFEAGCSLTEVLEVARKLDQEAAVAEVPELGVVVVRYLNVPDDHPARTDYLVVPNGHFLVYSEKFDLLYESEPKRFAREHQKT